MSNNINYYYDTDLVLRALNVTGTLTLLGNVGIGTTVPNTKLNLVGTQYGVSNSLHNDFEYGNYEGIDYKKYVTFGTDNPFYNSGALSVYKNGTESIRLGGNGNSYFNGGNIGIGTTSPSNQLHLEKGYTGTLYEASSITLGTIASNLSWACGSITGYVASGTSNSTSGFPGGLLFKTKSADGNYNQTLVNRMVIDSNGTVGIGTTTPTPGSILDVNGVTIVRGNILPNATITRDIGSSSLRFNNTYSDRIITSNISTTKYPIVSMTTNSTSGYTASSSSEYPGGLYPPYKAFDNDPSTFSHSVSLYNQSTGIYIGLASTTVSGTAYLGEYIQLQLSSAITLNSYSLTCRPLYLSSQCPNTWIIAGSTDGSTWTLIDSKTMGTSTALSFWTSLNKKYFRLDRPASYTYYRMICTVVGEFGIISSDRQYFVLAEFELFNQDSVSILGETSIYGYTTLYGGINQKKEGLDVVAIGNNAGQYTQGINSVAIGNNAGQYTQGINSVAIGNNAGQTNQPANSIILNANISGFTTATQSNALYVNPIRNDTTSINQNPLYYNPTTKEITYNTYNQVSSISQKVSGETVKKDIIPFNIGKISITNSDIDFYIDNYIENAQEYTFGRSSQNVWVGVGTGTNTIAYSTNGKTFLGLGTTIFSIKGNGVSWNGNIWVAVGSGTNTIAYSYNGINWFGGINSNNIFTEGISVAWNGYIWIVGGSGISNTMAYSYDGINWTGLGFIFKDYCRRIEWNGNLFVAVGGGISKATFTGGTDSYYALSTTAGTSKNALATFKTMCCSSTGQYQYALSATGSDGTLTAVTLYKSSNYGASGSWTTTSNTSSTNYLQSICCSKDGRYVYFCNASTAVNIWRSYDFGVTLTSINIYSGGSTSGTWISCSGDGKTVYCVGEAFFAKSLDYGFNFSINTSIAVSGAIVTLSVMRGNACSIDGKYVMILRSSTSNGAVFVSDDYGSNWTSSTTVNNVRHRACCMSPTGQYMFVAPSIDTSSYISNNFGITWTKISTSLTGFSACCSDDFRYILSCDNSSGGTTNKIYFSNNYGQTFTDITDSPAIPNGYYSVCCSSTFNYVQYVANFTVYSKTVTLTGAPNNILNVTGITSGIIYPGMVLSGTGTTNTRITAIQSPNRFYTLNNSQSISQGTTITGTSSSMSYSYDGLNWNNNATAIFGNQGNGIGWNGLLWLSSGFGSSSFTSSILGTIQPLLSVTALSYGTLYPGLNVTGGTINSNTFISSGNVTFTGSISTTSLTVTSTSGTISIGMILSGTGVISGTTITAFVSGSGVSGGTGTYTLSLSQTTTSTIMTGVLPSIGTTGNYYLTNSQTATGSIFTAGGTISFTGSISGTTLTVTSTTGIISIGMVLSGGVAATGVIPAGTTVMSLLTGNGSIGTYTVSVSQTIQSTTITGTLTTISGRYVTIIRTGSPNTINLNEIEIYDTTNTKITTGLTVTSSSFLDTQRGVAYLTDTVLTNNRSASEYFHSSSSADIGIGDTTGETNTGVWVQVDLGSVKTISCVKLYNRTDSAESDPTSPSDRIIGLRLFIKDANFNVVYKGTEISTTNFSYVLFPYTVAGTLRVGPLTGRYITFVRTAPIGDNVINLAEIEVYDGAVKYTTANTTPVMTASASSIFSNFNASNLIDGLTGTYCCTNGYLPYGTVGLTNTGEWVEVDLGANRTISKVILYNRTDASTARVLGLTMYVLDASRNVIYTGNQISNNAASYYMFAYPSSNVSSFSYSSTPCNFTGTITDNILTVSSVASGTLYVGATLTAGPSTSNRYISALGTGTTGVGTYILSNSQIISSRTITTGGSVSITASISGRILHVTAVSSGILSLGMVITNTGVTISSNTQIIGFGTGSGGIGSYLINNSQTATSGTITASFTTTFVGTIANTTNILNVNSVSIGALYLGTVLNATGVTGLYITSFVSGTGGTGTYMLSGNATQVIASGTITGTFNSSLFTASISDFDMYVTAVGSGTIYIGSSLTSGTGVLSNTFITSQASGTSGGVGYYTLKTSDKNGSFGTGNIVNITGNISGTTLTVTAVSGLVSIGMVLTSTTLTISANTYVTAFASGTNGGVGTYTINNSQSVAQSAISGFSTTTFTVIAHSAGANILTVNTPSIGIIYLGMVLRGDAGLNGLYISAYGTGTGGAGTYILSGNISVAIANAVSITGYFEQSYFSGAIRGTTLTISNIQSGTIYNGAILSNGNCFGSTYITSSNVNTISYNVNTFQSLASSALTVNGTGSATNVLAYSNDGINWTTISTISPSIFTEGYGISWNGKLWIVGGGGSGSSSSIIYSYDGLYWVGLGITIFSKCYNLFWNGCKWIGCGESSNKLAFANVDGTNWRGLTTASPFSTNCLDMGFNYKRDNRILIPKNMTIMGGQGATNTLVYSYDSGLTFTGLGTTIFSTICNHIEWNGSIWVAAGSGTNTMAYSFDGLNWVGLGTNTFGSEGKYVKWNGSMWVAGGITSSVGVIAYSYDSLTWIKTTTSLFTVALYSFEFNGKIWIAGGRGTNTLAYSYDGINWVGLGATIFSDYCLSVKWNGKIFIAGGFGTNTLAYSTNGLNWIALGSSTFSDKCNSVSWNENIWLAGGSGTNTIAYSTDGINWTGLGNTPFTSNCYGVHWNGTYWIAGGAGTNATAYSSNGINWTGTGITIFNLAGIYANSTRNISSTYIQHPLVSLGLGSNHTLGYSANDGLSWTGTGKNIFPLKSNTSCWNGSIWVAGGVSNTATFLGSNLTPNITTLTVSEMLYDYPTLNPSVSAWGSTSAIFSQATTAQQPTFDLTSVNFNGGVAGNATSGFLSNNNLQLNINSNGGFTAIAYVKFTGTPINYERIFDFGQGQASNNLVFGRSTNPNLTKYSFIVYTGNASVTEINGGTLNQNEWATISIVYTIGNNPPYKMYKNGIQFSTTTVAGGTNDNTTTSLLNRTLTSNLIAKSNWSTDGYSTMSLRGLLVYDRALSDTELTTANNALIYSNTNFSTTNLKVRLLISPNTGNIYPGMTISGTGITSNTQILLGPTTGGTGSYTISSTSNVSAGTIVNAVSSSLAYSKDGLTWTGIGNSIFSNTCNNIIWTGSNFVATGEGSVSFIGSITGTTLTVTSILSGSIYVGMTVYGSGITASTKISSFSSGIGSVGIYTVNNSQTISSITMTGTPITVAYSTDGINWTPSQNQIASGANPSVYDGKKTIVGSTGSVSFVGSITGTTLTVSEILYDYPIANPSVSRWNSFSQYRSTTNQPTFDGTSVNFNRANSQYLSNNNLNLNINNNGGFTAIAYVKFSGTVISAERILDFCDVFSTSNTGNGIQFYRHSTTQNIVCSLSKNGSNYASVLSSGNEIIQNEWAVFSVRYTKVGTYTSPIQLYKNKTLIATTTSNSDPINFTTTYNFIGRDTYGGATYTNGSIGGLLVYDRALLDAELNNATDALVNKTLNFSTVNLQVRLLTMNPNAGIIYPGMTISGGAISSGTTISSYGTGSGGVGTYTISSSQTVSSSAMNGSNVNLSSSTDLVTWTSSTSANLPTNSIAGVSWNGVRYIAVGSGTNTIAYSSDLSSWTAVTSQPFTSQGNCVFWNGLRFVSVGSGSNTIATSTDGITWSAISNSLTIFPLFSNSISWTGKKWIASGPVNTSSFTGSISGTTLTVTAFTNSPLIYVGMIISGTGVATGTKIVSGTASPYTVNINQVVSSTTMTGITNSIAYSNDGLVWNDSFSSPIFSVQCVGVTGNPRAGAVVVDSQIVLDRNGNGLSDNLEIVSDKYYNSDYNTISSSFRSRVIN
jgi:hypothetical protein